MRRAPSPRTGLRGARREGANPAEPLSATTPPATHPVAATRRSRINVVAMVAARKRLAGTPTGGDAGRAGSAGTVISPPGRWHARWTVAARTAGGKTPRTAGPGAIP